MTIPTLKHITFHECPECGNTDIGKVQLGNGFGSHTCGKWREFITFRCGAEYEYSPNFDKVLCNKPCIKAGVEYATVDVTVRLTLQVRKGVDISELNPGNLIKIPGTDDYSLGNWENSRRTLDHLEQVAISQAELVKMTKIKKKQ